MQITTIDKDKAIQDWAAQNPFLTDALLFNYLQENAGSCAFVPLAGESVVKRYIDGTKCRVYDFAIQVMFPLSDATDDVNTRNVFTQRVWQDWIEEQEALSNYPDFGDKCSDYSLENLANMPQLAQSYDNGMAKYQFMARLKYTEVR